MLFFVSLEKCVINSKYWFCVLFRIIFIYISTKKNFMKIFSVMMKIFFFEFSIFEFNYAMISLEKSKTLDFLVFIYILSYFGFETKLLLNRKIDFFPNFDFWNTLLHMLSVFIIGGAVEKLIARQVRILNRFATSNISGLFFQRFRKTLASSPTNPKGEIKRERSARVRSIRSDARSKSGRHRRFNFWFMKY